MATLHSLEFIHVYTKDALKASSKDRLRYSGSTAVDSFGPVAKPDATTAWHASIATKRQIYGSARVAVGGRTEGCGVDADGNRAKPVFKDKDELEQVFFHSLVLFKLT